MVAHGLAKISDCEGFLKSCGLHFLTCRGMMMDSLSYLVLLYAYP